MAKRAIHTSEYNREAILATLMAAPQKSTPAKRSNKRAADGTVSFKQAIVVKGCAEAARSVFTWVDKPRPGRYIIAVDGVTLSPEEVSTIIAARKSR